MTLNQKQFDILIQKLEVFARKQPSGYKLRVALLATLGYAYIFAILAATLTLLVGIVWLMLNTRSFNANAIKAIIFLLAFGLILVRSLWVSFPAPTGLYVKRKDLPGLYAFVDELSSKLQAPCFHQILLVDDFNAAVMQRPRLGLLGWQQNYLIIGLPLMLALTTEQFRAVLAHELGHLSGNHSRFAGWIYRQRLTWYRIAEGLGAGGNETSWFIFERFLKWYVPFFNAYSFVLARMDEYEADRCAAELTGAKNVAEALINVDIKARFLENPFFSSVYKRVQTEIDAPKIVFTEMKSAFLKEIPSTESSLYLTQALARKTNNDDTHPCLRDRLNALQCLPKNLEEISLPVTMKVSAAREVLGTALDKLLEHFNQIWYDQMTTPWRQKYAQFQESLATLKKLESKSKEDKLNTEESWQRVKLTLEFKGESVAFPLLKELLDIDSNDISANYLMGQVLLNQQNPSGIKYIEKAMDRDIHIVVDGCQIIYSFLMQKGDTNAAQLYKQRAEKHYDKMLKAQQERECIQTNDKFQPHGLSQAQLNSLYQQLSGYTQIKTVYLVQKTVEHFPEKALYILGVKRKVGFWGEVDTPQKNSNLVQQLSDELEFHHNIFFLMLTGEYANFEKPLRKVPDALIYKNHQK
ncbi:M48 family metallopeptidase [Scytonema sp. UIC 10036]|uniref:M48 family metallopeptidase n=1 Tax=Scytonema sp. UIC 10036 TaxID=2304196 RepID=UPI0012DAA951|nr:M48 family metallopeptidase [Scytonema sp. UIC 10036]